LPSVSTHKLNATHTGCLSQAAVRWNRARY
jgi:hypothetical protein